MYDVCAATGAAATGVAASCLCDLEIYSATTNKYV